MSIKYTINTIGNGGGSSGEVNTASNVGLEGIGLYKSKVGVDLQFKKIFSDEGLKLFDNISDDILELGFYGKQQIYNRLEEALTKEADVILTTTNADDLRNTINNLTDGQILEIKTNAVYNYITIPSGKRFVVRNAFGYTPTITDARCIRIDNGADKVVISGIIIDGSTNVGGNNNYTGTAITYSNEASKCSNIIFHNITCVNNTSGSAIVLGYYWNNPVYYTDATENDLSDNIAFVNCNFFDCCKDGTEGANIILRAVKNSYILNCVVNNNNSEGRGIMLQGGVKNVWIENCKVFNIGKISGNAEGIKIDSFTQTPNFFNTVILTNNKCWNCIEGIDIDDKCECIVLDNECFKCNDDGISLNDSSKGVFIGNKCHHNLYGIRLEITCTGILKFNNCYDNSTNYRIDNGYVYDNTNTSLLTQDKDLNYLESYGETTLSQITTPSNPSSGFNKFYFKSDDLPYILDSNGNENSLTTKSYVDTNLNYCDVFVTVGVSGADFTSLNSAIDFVSLKGGGNIQFLDEIYTYSSGGLSKNVSNITFTSKSGDWVAGGSMIFWNSGAGAWYGNNIAFKNIIIRARPGSSGSLITLNSPSHIMFDNCWLIIDGSTSPSLATSIINCNSQICRIYCNNTIMTKSAPGNRTTFTNDTNTTIFGLNKTNISSVNPLVVNIDSSSLLQWGTAGTLTLIDSHSNLTNRDIAGNHSKLIPNVDSTSAIQITKNDGLTSLMTFDTTNSNILTVKNYITNEGGIAIRLIAGENLVKGEVVCILQSGGVDGRVFKVPTSGNENDMPLGVVFANASLGSEVIVVVTGIVGILPESGITASRGYHISTSTTEAGRVTQNATIPVAATHFKEVGHWLDTGSGNGIITRAVIHFN